MCATATVTCWPEGTACRQSGSARLSGVGIGGEPAGRWRRWVLRVCSDAVAAGHHRMSVPVLCEIIYPGEGRSCSGSAGSIRANLAGPIASHVSALLATHGGNLEHGSILED